jgi:hypothetical protein
VPEGERDWQPLGNAEWAEMHVFKDTAAAGGDATYRMVAWLPDTTEVRKGCDDTTDINDDTSEATESDDTAEVRQGCDDTTDINYDTSEATESDDTAEATQGCDDTTESVHG